MFGNLKPILKVIGESYTSWAASFRMQKRLRRDFSFWNTTRQSATINLEKYSSGSYTTLSLTSLQSWAISLSSLIGANKLANQLLSRTSFWILMKLVSISPNWLSTNLSKLKLCLWLVSNSSKTTSFQSTKMIARSSARMRKSNNPLNKWLQTWRGIVIMLPSQYRRQKLRRSRQHLILVSKFWSTQASYSKLIWFGLSLWMLWMKKLLKSLSDSSSRSTCLLMKVCWMRERK